MRRSGSWSPAMAEQLLTPQQVAAIYGVHPKTVVRWSNTGRLPCIFTPNGHRRFQLSVVKAQLKRGGPA